MQATQTVRALIVGAAIGGLIMSQTVTAQAVSTSTEQFHKTVTGRAAVTKTHPTVHLYDNDSSYNQDGVKTVNDALWAPLKGGSKANARGFAAWFLVNDFTYGTMTVKMRRNAGSGFGLAVMRWTTGNDSKGGEVDFAEVTGGDAKTGRVSIHHHPNLGRCEQSGWCPDAVHWTTTADVDDWHTYKVKIDPDRTTYYIDGHQIGTTTNYPAGPTVKAGYRGRLTIQSKCMIATCQSGELRIASVSVTR